MDNIVKTADLAQILGVSTRRIRQLAEDRIITRSGSGYALAESVQGYIMYKVETDRGDLDKERREAETRLKKAKARRAEIETAELEGRMHRSEDVEALTEDLIYAIRGALLALPDRLAVDVVNTASPAEAADVIRKEVYAVMTELSSYQYDPEKYAERVRDRQKWNAIMGEADKLTGD